MDHQPGAPLDAWTTPVLRTTDAEDTAYGVSVPADLTESATLSFPI